MKCALFGEASKTIAEFKSKFASLDKSFNEKVWDGTALGVRQILENQRQSFPPVRTASVLMFLLLRLVAAQIAESMARSASLLTSNHNSCHPGTQVAIMKEITDWIDGVDEGVPRVFLLSGMAGTGKSTIAYTIANSRQGEHYTSFAFNRRAPIPPAPEMLFPHIAAFLSTFYPAVRKALIERKEIASDLEWQLRTLILEPLKQLRPNAPRLMVIVIDALDEADDDGVQAARLASLLVTACDELPHNIRIFVTSRVETYVVKTFWPSPVQRLDMPDSSDRKLLAEVRLLIKNKLKDIPGIDEFHYDNLMTTSQGLFQWAATACKEIIGAPGQGGSTPLQRYNMVVASGLGRDKSGLLDSLYKDVLNRAFAPEDHLLLKQVIAALFVMMEPMTLDAFRHLYGNASDVDRTLPYLPSILDGISDRTHPVQPNHTSLRDFFFVPDRSGPFYVKDSDLSDAHGRVAHSSLKIVSASLLQVTCTHVASEAVEIQGEISCHVEYSTLR